MVDPHHPEMSEQGAAALDQDPGHATIAQIMRQLALEAGAETLRWFQDEGLVVERKEDASPVSQADKAADAVIVGGLAAYLPHIPVVTEEREESHAQSGAARYFLVDPLDGTKEFISGRGDYTVNIGLIENGVPVLGVVYAPARARLFWTPDLDLAVQEEGEMDPEGTGAGRCLRVVEPDNDALRIVASKSHMNEATQSYVARYAQGSLVNAGSSLKFCLLAAGEADLYPRLGPTMEWDTAAGHAVLLAAGGRVDALVDGEAAGPLGYHKPGLLNGNFVAYAPDVALKNA
ncbi:MAG: 3'(2'),5'-bisphosphate nucleotidase CysQ [Neomegalonema sp.]|nr:3'(2'),5'-bisphosphate nucleotidase CysQ [Neomegalonema sp.]